MSYGFIDSASIMNAVSAFSCHKNYEEWGEWEKRTVIEVTGALFLHQFLSIAPGPSAHKMDEGKDILYICYDLACNQLGTIIGTTYKDAPKDVLMKAKINYQKWLFENIEDVKTAIEQTVQDKGYPHWEQWAIEHAWIDHSNRLSGLFNPEMIDELAIILQVQSNELSGLWKKTTNLQQVKKWSQGINHDGDFDLAKKAFTASAVLRGGYHDMISNQMNWQILHHPIRKKILLPLWKGNKYKISKAIEYISNIIVYDAINEKKPQDRILCWTENIGKIQNAYWKNLIPEILNTELDQEDAFQLAIKTIDKLHLRLYRRSLYKTLDIAIALTTSSSSFLVFSWPWNLITWPILGMGTWMLGERTKLSRRVTEKLVLTEKRLRDLAISKPGRIERNE